MIKIEGITKQYTFEEAKEAITNNDFIEAIVAFKYIDLIQMQDLDEFWNALEEGAVDADYISHEGINEELIEYNKEHGVLLFKVTMSLLDVEKYN